MKKTFTLCFSLVMATILTSFSQSLKIIPLGDHLQLKVQKQSIPAHSQKQIIANKTNSSESFWLNYAEDVDTYNGSTAKSWIGTLFPDSTVIVCNSNGCFRPWVHLIGNVLDVRSAVFSTVKSIKWNIYNTYTVDSIGLGYSYQRHHPDPSIVDTLLVYLYSNATAANLPTYYYTGSKANYGVDTVRFRGMKYSYIANTPNAAGMVTIKVPLMASDTSAAGYLTYKEFSTNSFAIPGGRLVVSAFGFKPGYAYNANDTITKTKNTFAFLGYEESGDNTYPKYYPGEWNVSAIVPTVVRYNIDTIGYNGLFIPTYGWGQSYSTEHIYVSYKVTSNNVGISESASAMNGIKLYQNQPNPFNKISIINYEIIDGGDVSLEIYDLSGRLLISLNQGNKNTGRHSVIFDGSEFSKGVYFYTLKVKGASLTRKMVITN
jgi:hypothetical protein